MVGSGKQPIYLNAFFALHGTGVDGHSRGRGGLIDGCLYYAIYGQRESSARVIRCKDARSQ